LIDYLLFCGFWGAGEGLRKSIGDLEGRFSFGRSSGVLLALLFGVVAYSLVFSFACLFFAII